MGIFKKKKSVSTDDYFDMENNEDMNTDYFDDSNNDFMDSDEEDYQPKKKKKNVAGTIGSVIGVIAVIAVVLAVGYLVFALITGPSKKQCKTLLADFQYSCNELDLSGIADNLEPGLSTKVKAAILAVDLLTDQDTDELLKMIINTMGSGIMPEDSTAEITDIFKTITIEPVKFGFPGKRRVVKCRCSFMGIDQYMNFTIGKANGKCYISHVETAKN